MTDNKFDVNINDLPDKKQQQIILRLNQVPDGLKVVDIDSLIRTLNQVAKQIDNDYQKNPHDPRLRMEKMISSKTNQQSALGAGLKNMQDGGIHYGIQAGDGLYAFSKEGMEQLHRDLQTSNELQRQLLKELAKRDEPTDRRRREAKMPLYKQELQGHLGKMAEWTSKVKKQFKKSYYGVKKLGLTLLLGVQNAYKAFKGTLDKAYAPNETIVPNREKADQGAYNDEYDEPKEEQSAAPQNTQAAQPTQAAPAPTKPKSEETQEQASQPVKQDNDQSFNLFDSLNGADSTAAPAEENDEPGYDYSTIDDADLPEDMAPDDEDAFDEEEPENIDSLDDLDPEILEAATPEQDSAPKDNKNPQKGGEAKKQDPFYGTKQGFTCGLDDNHRFDKVLGRLGRKYGLTLDSKHYETTADNTKQQNVLMIKVDYPKDYQDQKGKQIVLALPLYTKDVDDLLKSNPKQKDLQKAMLDQIAGKLEDAYASLPKDQKDDGINEIILRSKLDHIYETEPDTLNAIAARQQRKLLYAGDDALTSKVLPENEVISFTKDKEGNINRVTKGELSKGINNIASFLVSKKDYTESQFEQIKSELGKELRHSILNGGEASTNSIYDDYLIKSDDHMHTKENLVRKALCIDQANMKRVSGMHNVDRFDPKFQRSVAFVDVDKNGKLHSYMLGQINQTASDIIENSKLDFSEAEKQDLNQKLFNEILQGINDSKGKENGIETVVNKYQRDKNAQNNLLDLSREKTETKSDDEPNLAHQNKSATIKQKQKKRTEYQTISDADINEQETHEKQIQK